MSIPEFDLEDISSQLERLIEAFQEWGCVRITNHGSMLPLSLAAEMKAVVRSLFNRPLEIKKRCTDVITGSGYVPPAKNTPHFETFGLYDIESRQVVNDFCDKLDASPHQRETITMYSDAICKIAKEIMNKIAQGLGLPGISCEDWPSQVRINKYNFAPETIGSSGLRIHTDTSFLTILQDDDNVSGLEIVDKSGVFVAVDPLPGTLIVNLGDIATLWSNGRLYNVKHRVICKDATTRISIGTFLLGPRDETVKSPAEFINSAHPRLYVPISYKDYRNIRFSNNMHTGDVLALFRADP